MPGSIREEAISEASFDDTECRHDDDDDDVAENRSGCGIEHGRDLDETGYLATFAVFCRVSEG